MRAYIAYARTDVRIAYSVVTTYAFRNSASNAAKPSLARYPTALQTPMFMYIANAIKFSGDHTFGVLISFRFEGLT